MARPLFVSGTARGGTNLAIMMASVHPAVELVQDPFLALLKSFRNALVTAKGPGAFDLQSPLDEYYYFDDRLAVMREIQEASFDLPFDQTGTERLHEALAARMKLSAPLLIPFVGKIRGKAYRDLLWAGLETISEARGNAQAQWLGFNDNWAIEFFGPAARTFPDARFVAIIRDVRGAVASHLRIVEAKHRNPLYQYEKNPAMIALTLSFVRCWRKQVAFARHYQRHTDIGKRLLVIAYEQLVRNPEQEVRRLCEFLDIDFRPEMIDASKFIAGDGRQWIPNSNHDGAPRGGIYTSTIERWRETLPPGALDLIEYVSGPDLGMAGYTVARPFTEGFPWEAYRFHAAQHQAWTGGSFGWRTDNRNPDVDFGLEMLRRNCLSQPVADPKLIERCFLFPEIYEDLRAGATIQT